MHALWAYVCYSSFMPYGDMSYRRVTIHRRFTVSQVTHTAVDRQGSHFNGAGPGGCATSSVRSVDGAELNSRLRARTRRRVSREPHSICCWTARPHCTARRQRDGPSDCYEHMPAYTRNRPRSRTQRCDDESALPAGARLGPRRHKGREASTCAAQRPGARSRIHKGSRRPLTHTSRRRRHLDQQ